MATNVVVPGLGESVVEATVGDWSVSVGDVVSVGDLLVELQTDKVDLEVTADVAGTISEILKATDEDVEIGDTLAVIAESGESAPAKAEPVAEAPKAEPSEQPKTRTTITESSRSVASPVAKRIAAERGIDLSEVSGSGRGGKVMKSDVTGQPEPKAATPVAAASPSAATAAKPQRDSTATSALAEIFGNQEREERVKMSRRRRTIAKNLVQAQQTAAMLTTFQEVDMHNVMELRKRRKAWFEEKFGTRLGFMSFFVKATVAALKEYPTLNAEIDGDQMVLKKYYDIGIAVGAEEGLVVPVVRNADQLSFAGIEKKIRELGKAARDGNLKIEDMMGGTFTITNGGVFGSMLSTPILNTPQVGILGMHNIVQRPVVVDGEVVVRPIMYLAMSYDHRIVDGNTAVRFLYRVKELIEDPEDLMLAG